MEQMPSIPQDDLIDVMEMTKALEKQISETLNGNQSSLAISALMSASINCMVAQCKTLSELMFFRNIFMQTIDSAIVAIKINNLE